MAPRLPPDAIGLDDDRLAARARDGDRAAFGELVRRHQAAALRVAAVISGSTEEASDIVQDAMVKAHRHLATHRGGGTVRSWMLRIVANEAKNHVRGRARRRRRDDWHAAREVTVPGDAPPPMVADGDGVLIGVQDISSRVVRLAPDGRLAGWRLLPGVLPTALGHAGDELIAVGPGWTTFGDVDLPDWLGSTRDVIGG